MVGLLSLPRPARAPAELLAVEATDQGLTVAVCARQDGEAAVLRLARGPATGDLAADLRRALAAVAPAPRHALLLTPRATAACLVTPPTRGLTAERLAGLVRYELEPYLPADEAPDPSTPAACGWADRDPEAGGPLYACGLTGRARRELERAFAAAGLRLAGIYPLLGCAPALLPPDGPAAATVLEVAHGRVAAARLERGRVTVVSLTRAADAAAAVDAAAAATGGAAGQVLLAGPAPPEVVAALPGVARLAAGAGAGAADGGGAGAPSASLLGAARHALGLPGAGRIPAVGPEPAPPLLSRPAVQVGAILALAAAALLGADALLVARAARTRADLTALRAEVDARRAVDDARKALERRRDAATRALEPLRAAVARAEAEDARCGWLEALLAAVVRAAPADVALRALRDEPDGAVVVEGLALTPADAQRLAADLGRAPALAGRAPPAVAVVADAPPEARLAAGPGRYRFTVRFARPGAPTAAVAPPPAPRED